MCSSRCCRLVLVVTTKLVYYIVIIKFLDYTNFSFNDFGKTGFSVCKNDKIQNNVIAMTIIALKAKDLIMKHDIMRHSVNSCTHLLLIHNSRK